MEIMNWPELLVGALLGFALSLPFYIHERQERKREVGLSWTRDLRTLEPLILQGRTTHAEFTTATRALPLDHYRRVLGPDDFRLVEDFQNALAGAELHPSPETHERLHTLRIKLANRGRFRSSDEYDDLTTREQWQDRRRHPLRWLKNEVYGYFRRRGIEKMKAEKMKAEKKSLPPQI